MYENMKIKIFVKNVTDDIIILPEIGGYPLQPGEEIDILDNSFEKYTGYSQPHAAIKAIYKLSGTELYKKRESGDIKIRKEVSPA